MRSPGAVARGSKLVNLARRRSLGRLLISACLPADVVPSPVMPWRSRVARALNRPPQAWQSESVPTIGRRARALRGLLLEAGLQPNNATPARPTGAEHHGELLGLYRSLGGLLERPVWRPGTWDLSFDGALVVELDEQLHFNRYRGLTLGASWSPALPWTDAYRVYCARHEERCLRDGRGQQRWTNPSCARHFSGGPVGDLAAGAPRWKQRAFYDALKDTAPAAGLQLAFARIAIHDAVDGKVLDDVLEGRSRVDPQAVLELVEARTARPARAES
jgi:hypothetical protein